MRVYVAAASSDIERANAWIAALRALDIEVTCTWPDVIAKVGAANPRTATPAQRHEWAMVDIMEVERADALWLLCPPRGIDAPGRGAYFEMGIAHARGKEIVASGDTLQSIFAAISIECADDRDAFEWVCHLARKGRIPR